MSDDAKIAVFLLHACGRSAGALSVGGATSEGVLAADLLQIQRGEIFDSIFDCSRVLIVAGF
jgi:hypothetical protein